MAEQHSGWSTQDDLAESPRHRVKQCLNLIAAPTVVLPLTEAHAAQLANTVLGMTARRRCGAARERLRERY